MPEVAMGMDEAGQRVQTPTYKMKMLLGSNIQQGHWLTILYYTFKVAKRVHIKSFTTHKRL